MTAIGWNQKTIDTFHTQKGRGIMPWGDNLQFLSQFQRCQLTLSADLHT